MIDGGGPGPEVATPEPEPNYTELRQSIDRLGEVVPGLTAKMKHEGQEETVVLPHRTEQIDMRDPFGFGDEWTVAVTDNGIRELRFRAPMENYPHDPTRGFRFPVDAIIEEVVAQGGNEENILQALNSKGEGAHMYSSVPEKPKDAERMVSHALWLRANSLGSKQYGEDTAAYQKDLPKWDALSKGLFSGNMDDPEPVVQKIKRVTGQVAGIQSQPAPTETPPAPSVPQTTSSV